jgi:8-oxo-dGTP pyrophosphatase MutT (NUDIX family)
MKILAEIHRRPGINTQRKTIYRTAVRGVILRGRDLLMIYSSNVGDYKFPGGGVSESETHAQALSREIQEECGTSLIQIGDEIGAVIEYGIPMDRDYDIFKMTSHYYQCEVEDGFGAQKLDGYEQDLGFKPVWISIERAIQFNKALLDSEKSPEWLKREIFVLEYIQRGFEVAHNR